MEQTQTKQRHKFISFWLWFCIFANLISILPSVKSYQDLGNLGYYGVNLITQRVDIEPFRNAIHPHILILQVVAAISGIFMIVGYAKLLKWKKSGFWLLVITAIVTAILNAIMMNCIEQDYALLNMTYNWNPLVQVIAIPASVFVLWAILQIKRDGVSCWKNLESGSKSLEVQFTTSSTAASTVETASPNTPAMVRSTIIEPVTSESEAMQDLGNVAPSEAPRFCAQCGAKLSQGANFCHSCGAPVPVQEPTPNVTETPKDWESYFRNILQKNFPQFTVKENVPVTELTGDINDVFRLYKERPNQVYKAEWGKPYNFVLYSEGKAKAVIMLATTNEHSVKVTYLISKMFAKKLNVPYLGFYTKFNNKEEYVVNRIKNILC